MLIRDVTLANVNFAISQEVLCDPIDASGYHWTNARFACTMFSERGFHHVYYTWTMGLRRPGGGASNLVANPPRRYFFSWRIHSACSRESGKGREIIDSVLFSGTPDGSPPCQFFSSSTLVRFGDVGRFTVCIDIPAIVRS
jgi:hypothetical protein